MGYTFCFLRLGGAVGVGVGVERAANLSGWIFVLLSDCAKTTCFLFSAIVFLLAQVKSSSVE